MSSKFKVQSSRVSSFRFQVSGFKSLVYSLQFMSSKFKVQGSKFKVQGGGIVLAHFLYFCSLELKRV
jgi:hypothetical protein